MILKFPDIDTLRLSLTSGAVPPAVALTAAVAGIDDQNQVWVEPAAPLPRTVQNDLRRLGVQVCKVRGAAEFAGELLAGGPAAAARRRSHRPPGTDADPV